MHVVRLRHVKSVRRKGRAYYYHRKTGERLPDDDEERAKRVLEINGEARRRGPMPGAFAELIAAYKASSAYTSLAERSKLDYDRHLDLIGDAWGTVRVGGISRRDCLELRDTMAAAPRQANYLAAVLRRLLSFAVDRGYRVDNPALRPGKLQEGEGFKAWPAEVLQRFLAAAYPELRQAIELVALTGQRPQDAVALTWGHVRGGGIMLAQLKTRERLWVPLYAPLRKLLETIPRRAAVILTTPTGRPWTQNWLSRETAKVMGEIGEAGKGYTPHGLRHSAGDALAEAGCSAKEIAAILGHRTLAMVGRYTRSADQKRLAKSAVVRLQRAASRTRSDKSRGPK